MKKKFAFFFFLVSISSSFAALPPLYQSIKEFKALLDDPKLTKNLSSGEMITEINKVDNDFEITTNKQKMNVRVVYQSQKQPGPAVFKLEFSTPIPLYED